MRRAFSAPALVLPITLALVFALMAAHVARADEFDPEQIKAALHTATEEEGGFIDNAVSLVKAGTLPRDIFASTFLWARKKPRRKFQYFKQALTLRAAEVGVQL